MAVTGSYMAMRVWNAALRHVSAYGECVRNEIMPVFANLESRADAVAAAEFERLGAEPAGEFWDGDMGVPC